MLCEGGLALFGSDTGPHVGKNREFSVPAGDTFCGKKGPHSSAMGRAIVSLPSVDRSSAFLEKIFLKIQIFM